MTLKKLPKLRYEYSALEPHIDTRTMTIHHTKHHQAYVDNLNQALADHPELQDRSTLSLLRDLDSLPETIRTAVRNNGGGHINHTLFWPCMSPKGGGLPTGSLASAIDETFGSFDDFKTAFTQAGMTRFGSGWAWLSVAEGKLVVTSTPNQDNPVADGLIPILGLDVWEHAYYLEYQNRRADYVAAWWQVVDWNHVNANYTMAKVEEGVANVTDWAQSTWAKIEESWQKLVE
jgi:Fe-Mn family superoxide dismutase